MIIFSLLCLVTILSPHISTSTIESAHSYIQIGSSELSVSVLKEFDRNLLAARLLRINNETVALAGTNSWRNETWKDSQGNLKSFDAEWVKIAIDSKHYDEQSGAGIKIKSQVFEDYWNKNCRLLFMSEYNGTHFSQAIVVINKTANFTVALMGGHVIQDDGFYYLTHQIANFSGGIEINRTTFFANSTDSIYNPTQALYNAILAMRANNYSFMSVESIFIIPQEFIPRQLNITITHFLWYIRFNYYGEHPLLNTTASTDYKYDYEYHVFAFPNGTLLRIDRVGGPVVYPCESCNNSAVYVFVVVVIIFVPVTFLMLRRRKRHKRLFQNSIQS